MAKNKPQLIELAVPGFIRHRCEGVRRRDIFQSDELLICLLCPECGQVGHPMLRHYYTAYRSMSDVRNHIRDVVDRIEPGKLCESCRAQFPVPRSVHGFYFYYSPFVATDLVIEVRHSAGEAIFYEYKLSLDEEMRLLEQLSSGLTKDLFRPALYHFRKGYVSHNIRGDLADARTQLTKAIEYFPRFWQSHLELAALAIEEGELDTAGERLMQAEQCCDEENNLCKVMRVKLLLELGNVRPALQICERILAEDPQNVEAWYYKGLALGRANDLSAARDALKRAVSLDPSHVRAARALQKMGLLSLLPGPLRRLWGGEREE